METKQGSLYYIIPAQIMHDENLSHAEKITYALISGLADDQGKCFPSSEWLSKKIGVDERNIRRILEKLEKNEYIMRETISCKSDPFKKYRIIHICHNFKKCLRAVKNDLVESDENVRIDRTKMTGIISEEDILISKDHHSGAKAPEPPPSLPKKIPKRKKEPEEMFEVAHRVFLSLSQQEALKKRLEGSNIDLKAVYLKLSDWKLGKQITGGRNDFSTIVKWVIDAVKSELVPKSTVPASAPIRDKAEQERKDRELAKTIRKKFWNLCQMHLIDAENSNYIEFNLGDRGGNVKVKIGFPGFREQCIKYLRQMNQDTTGL